jgi:iron complex transport system substrate-binding protein
MRACWPAMVAAACALAPLIATAGEPTVVRDGLDRVVTLPAPPQRIVTIFASNTEMVAALGLADRIVGIEAYTRYPPEVVSKPLVGGRLGFSVDAMVGLRPDLVIVTPARQAVNQLLDPMERLGVPVLVLLQRSVPEIFANIRLLGRAAGVPDWGEALAGRLEARLAGITRRVQDRKPPRALMITGRLGNGLCSWRVREPIPAMRSSLRAGASRLQGAGRLPRCRPRQSWMPIPMSCSMPGPRPTAMN